MPPALKGQWQFRSEQGSRRGSAGLSGCLAGWSRVLPRSLPGSSGEVLGASWRPPGASRGGAGGVWGPAGGLLGRSGGRPGAPGGGLGPFGGLLGGSGGLLTAFWVGPGASWGPPRAGPGASWGVLGASWGALGRPSWPLGAYLDRSEAFLSCLEASLLRKSEISFPPRRERHFWASEGLVLGLPEASRGFLGAS